MITAIFISLLFIISAIFQVSFVHTFAFPLALVPIHFLIGVVILQRAGHTAGGLWFLASTFLLNLLGFSDGTWWAYWISGAFGIILTKKVFTSHSVYGLAGLGISMYVIFFFLNAFTQNYNSLREFIMYLITGIIGLVIGIYFAFLAANGIEKISQSILITRKNKRLIWK